MSRWFRMYDDVLDDPKVQRLDPHLFKVWVNLLCLASRNDGRIPCADDTAFSLRTSVEAVRDAINSLIDKGLIDIVDDEPVPHNWDKRQFRSDRDESAAKRQAEKRARDNGSRNGRVTRDVTRDVTDASRPPDTETDTETEEKKESSPLLSLHAGKSASPSAQPKLEPRGSRLPDDFSPSPAVIETARSDLGLSDDQIKFEISQFTDYWRGRAGAQARKTDWQATLRVWLRKSADDRKNRNHRSANAQQGAIVTSAIAEQRRVIAERQAAGGFAHPRPGRDPTDERDFSP